MKTIQWSSSDEAVATVGADGTVTALKEGTAVITAKCGEKSAECTVTVKAEAVMPTSITMEADNAEPDGGTEIHPNSHNIAGECNQ